MKFHSEQQDTESPVWKRLVDLIEEAVADRREEFAPLRGMGSEDRSQVVTLPSTISRLKAVKRFLLYGSNLIRIPAEIGEMENLEEFIPYTSYRLHWFPYEINRCKKLKKSTVSTRALYGNWKHRMPFPKLPTEKISLGDAKKHLGVESIETCSVCNRPFEDPKVYQVWVSLWVAADVLPLLVNACSEKCIRRLPKPPRNYLRKPHWGGLDLEQPSR